MLGDDIYLSCSVDLPIFCQWLRVMEQCEAHPGYVAQIQKAFQKNLEMQKQNTKFIQSG